MIKITNYGFETEVSFENKDSHGRMSTECIIVSYNCCEDKFPTINIPATGSIAIKSIPELITAIELAAMIANGKLKVSDV